MSGYIWIYRRELQTWDCGDFARLYTFWQWANLPLLGDITVLPGSLSSQSKYPRICTISSCSPPSSFIFLWFVRLFFFSGSSFCPLQNFNLHILCWWCNMFGWRSLFLSCGLILQLSLNASQLNFPNQMVSSRSPLLYYYYITTEFPPTECVTFFRQNFCSVTVILYILSLSFFFFFCSQVLLISFFCSTFSCLSISSLLFP